MAGAEAFLGTWEFDPAEAVYEGGEPPREGSYTIAEDGDELAVTMAWVDASGAAQNGAYRAKPDGREYALPDPGVADTMKTALSGSRVMDTITRKDGVPAAIGRRTVSADGKSMVVVQSARLADGRWAHHRSVYGKRE